eukprot:2943262-Alexandrium_andersonii.AAC.1
MQAGTADGHSKSGRPSCHLARTFSTRLASSVWARPRCDTRRASVLARDLSIKTSSSRAPETSLRKCGRRVPRRGPNVAA